MRIVVYTKKPCVQCDATIRHLGRLGVEPVQVRIDDEDGAPILEELKTAGYLTAPVVKVYNIDPETGDVVLVDEWGGFIPDKLNEHVRAAA